MHISFKLGAEVSHKQVLIRTHLNSLFAETPLSHD